MLHVTAESATLTVGTVHVQLVVPLRPFVTDLAIPLAIQSSVILMV